MTLAATDWVPSVGPASKWPCELGQEQFKVIHRASDRGLRFFETAEGWAEMRSPLDVNAVEPLNRRALTSATRAREPGR